MKLLLDTHSLIWAPTDAPELGDSGSAVILAAQGIWFSEASIWEIGLKWRKGKINLQPRRILHPALRDGFRTLALDLESILLSYELRQEHGDTFDRLRYAKARHHGHRLMTMDRALSGIDLAAHRRDLFPRHAVTVHEITRQRTQDLRRRPPSSSPLCH